MVIVCVCVRVCTCAHRCVNTCVCTRAYMCMWANLHVYLTCCPYIQEGQLHHAVLLHPVKIPILKTFASLSPNPSFLLFLNLNMIPPPSKTNAWDSGIYICIIRHKATNPVYDDTRQKDKIMEHRAIYIYIFVLAQDKSPLCFRLFPVLSIPCSLSRVLFTGARAWTFFVYVTHDATRFTGQDCHG